MKTTNRVTPEQLKRLQELERKRRRDLLANLRETVPAILMRSTPRRELRAFGFGGELLTRGT
jgi:hypothetical protein